jgi:L-histidine N-alpha-methyltransferase
VKGEFIAENIGIEERSQIGDYRAALAQDVRDGLSRELKELPPKYFYDERGAELFEEITGLPEYYQTRTERSILEGIAPKLAATYRPERLVEFGSGSATKTRLLLSAMNEAGTLRRYVPIDISREMLIASSEEVVREYPGMRVDAVIGDFHDGLKGLSSSEKSLIIFLGGTIGNFRYADAADFLRNVASGMGQEDLFLLGVDLVKDPARLNAAYNDAAGVTAEFNLNVLDVVNRELEGKFDRSGFAHYAFYNPRESQIEMHLASLRDQSVAVGGLGVEVQFHRGETILTEISRKFTRASAGSLLAASGMMMIDFHTDPEALFALCLAKKA